MYKSFNVVLALTGFALTVCGPLALLPGIALPEMLVVYTIMYWAVGLALLAYDTFVLLATCNKSEGEAIRYEDKMLLTGGMLKLLFYFLFLAAVVEMAMVIGIANYAKERGFKEPYT